MPDGLENLDIQSELDRRAIEPGLESDVPEARAPKIPTWAEVLQHPDIKGLSEFEKEQARNAYWKDVIEPVVPKEHLRAARTAFDTDTRQLTRDSMKPMPKPGILDRFKAAWNSDQSQPMETSDLSRVSEAEAQAATEKAGQPARMTATRGGQPQLPGGRVVTMAPEVPGKETAPIMESVKAAPKLFQLGMVQAIPQTARMVQDLDQRIEDAAKTRDALAARVGQPYVPPDYNVRLQVGKSYQPIEEEALNIQRTLHTPADSLGSYESEVQGLDKTIADLTAQRDLYAKTSELVGKDIQEATPKNQGMGGKMLTTAAQSAGPMVAGAATGMVNPALGIAIGAGGGSVMQGSQAFEQTLTAGEDARKRLPEFTAAKNKFQYIREIANSEDADGTTRKAAVNALQAMQENADARGSGTLSNAAEAQANIQAVKKFGLDLQRIAENATIRSAKAGAFIQGAAEYFGEKIGLGAILKPGSALLPKLVESLATNFGQEFATQGVQTLDQVLRYDPTITLSDALEQMFVAGGAGAVTAGPLTVASHAAEKFAGRKFAGEPGPKTAPGETVVPPGAVPAERPAATPSAPPPAIPPAEKTGVLSNQGAEALTPVEPNSLDRVTAIDGRLAELSRGLQPEQPAAPEIADEIGKLRAERDQITRDWPKLATGNPTVFSTETGAELAGRYAVADADSLIASHDTNLRPNPAFPQELQPRARERAASELQVSNIVQKLNPARLGESADASNGSPIIGADGLVESGNARTIALQRVYQANGEKANTYRAWVAETAQRLGIQPEQLAGIKNPVLVRLRDTPVNRAEFTRQANASTTAQMSTVEQARSDAARIPSFDDLTVGETGEISVAGNRKFIAQFVGTLPVTEQAALVTGTGELSQSGYARIRNAILARAYGDSPVLMRMVESLDNNLRNITAALMRVAPQVAKSREAIAEGALHNRDITADILSAVEELSRLKDGGQNITEFLAQGTMFGSTLTPEAADLLRFLDANIRSPKKIAALVENYLSALAAIGNPNQGSLLGTTEAPSKQEIINQAKKGISDENAIPPGRPAKPAEDVRAGPAGEPRPYGEAGAQPGAQEGVVKQERDKYTASLQLESETPAEAHRKEEARAKIKRQKIQRETAPPPEDFFLSGSNRPADLAAAHGQTELFGISAENGQRAMASAGINAERRAAPRSAAERRQFEAIRGRWSQMSEAEKLETVQDLLSHSLTSRKTGLSNFLAYEQAPKLAVQVSIDADGLKWINDNLGHDIGDKLLKAIGTVVARHTDEGYHISGDEFVIQAKTQEEADRIMRAVRADLDEVTITGRDENGAVEKKGIGISYGTGSSLEQAEAGLKADKRTRAAAGARNERGAEPAGVVRRPAEGNEVRREGAGKEAVAAPAPEAKPAEEVQQAAQTGGAPAETFSGMYGKGMTALPARQALQRLTKEKPGLDWRVQPSKEFPERFEVAGYKRPSIAKQEAAVYAVNEPDPLVGDLFPESTGEVQQAAGNRPRRTTRSAAGDRNVHSARALSVREAPETPGVYFITSQLVTVGERALPVSRIKTVEDAARSFAYLVNHAVEHFDAIVTDKNGKPLAIIGSFKGAQTQTSVYPGTIAMELARIEGAANVWAAHNHPSGTPDLSAADRMMSGVISRVIHKFNINYHGFFAMARSGDSVSYSGTAGGGGDVRGTVQLGEPAKHRIPIVERTITGTSGVEPFNHADAAKMAAKTIAKDQPGILFLTAQDKLAAFVPMPEEEMLRLRIEGRAMRVLRAAARANASGAIVVNASVKAGNNIGAALTELDVRLLDVIYRDESNIIRSGAEHGTVPNIGTMMSREGGAGMQTADLERQLAPLISADANLPDGGVKVVQSVADLPAKLSDFAKSQNAGRTLEGLWDPETKTVYVVADHIGTAERAQFVLFHELYGHYGMRGLLGPALGKQLLRIHDINKNVQRETARQKRVFGYGHEKAIEEALANLAGKGQGFGGLRMLLRSMQVWLRAHGMDAVANWIENLSNAEALEFLAQAKRYVQEGNQPHVISDVPALGEGMPLFSRNLTPEQRAGEILSTKTPGFSPLEAVTKAAVKLTGIDKATSFAGTKLLELVNRITPEKVKAGMVSDYGLPEAVSDRRAAMHGKIRESYRNIETVLAALGNLTRAESRVAYEWMNTDTPQASDWFMNQLPPESVKTLADVEKTVDRLSEEAVRLGQLSPESRERNRFAYLRRSYVKHTVELTPQEQTNRKRAIAIFGDQYKGRGIVDGAEMSRIQNVAPEWWQRKFVPGRADRGLRGEEFVRLERRTEDRSAGSAPLASIGPAMPKRRLLEVQYFPAAEPVPAKFASWDRAGTWEVRDVKGSELLMWRDFTKAERETMGEIDEVKYAVARTLHSMIHDVEVGRYLEWISSAYSKATAADVPGEIVDARESLTAAYKPDQWVQVPQTEIQGTGGVKRYGKLAGRYVPAPIWNDLRQTVNFAYQPLGETYAKVLRFWKMSKTSLSPAVHTNNVMANLVMADWHDVRAAHVAKALLIMLDNKDQANKIIINRFEDSGGLIGTFAPHELRQEQLAPLLEELRKELGLADQGQNMIGVSAALQAAMQGQFRAAIAAASGSRPAVATAKIAKAMTDLYQAEDVVFRLAAFLKEKEQGASDIDAGKVARKSFLDYHINAPWVQMMRSTAFPFIAFTYRAVPMLLETAAKKPWKLLKLGMLIGGLNAIGYALSGGDEDRERKLLPDEKSGKTFGFLGPKLVRMPWNDEHGSPVFLDIRRWIPVGDVFDLGQTHSAVPVLPVAVPGGPLAVIAELLFNKSQFTGKEVTKETDTAGEKAAAVFDHLYKAMAPNLPFLPGTYSFTGIKNAATGKTDTFGREQSVGQAVLSAVGVKAGSYPADVGLDSLRRQRDKQIREISERQSALKRELMRHGINDEEFNAKMMAQEEKKREVDRKFAERLQ